MLIRTQGHIVRTYNYDVKLRPLSKMVASGAPEEEKYILILIISQLLDVSWNPKTKILKKAIYC